MPAVGMQARIDNELLALPDFLRLRAGGRHAPELFITLSSDKEKVTTVVGASQLTEKRGHNGPGRFVSHGHGLKLILTIQIRKGHLFAVR